MRNLTVIKLQSLFFLMLLTSVCLAQGVLKGVVTDAEGEPLIGASVLVQGTEKGTVTDMDGSFVIRGLDEGDYDVDISYIGYNTHTVDADISGEETNIGTIELNTGAIGLSEVEVIASLAKDRQTPVAVSTIKGVTVEALVGNQEYPEILKKTPSVYTTKQGGGFGDSRINIRGFNQRNVAVMINGIPVNDMENGWVYWSNWAGLADVTSSIQVQRGLGASKLAVSSVGGSINIITNAAELNRGGAVSVSVGNDGYQKYGVVLSSGLGEGGWAFSLQGTHTRGDGYIDGTMFRAYSYFASLMKLFDNGHSISLTALGAPQWHHQRESPSRFDNLTLRTFVNEDDLAQPDENTKYGVGTKFNWLWGNLDGEEFTFRRNFYHKPKVYLNHYWDITDRTELKTSLYASFGRGGGTGPRGRLRTPGSVFDSFSGFGTGIHDRNGQIRFEDIQRYNQGGDVEGFGPPKEQYGGRYIVSSDGKINGENTGSGFIRRASMNSHNWYGILSSLSHELNDRWNLVAGFDGRYYKGIHYRRVENLLGADGYLSTSDENNPENIITAEVPAEFGSFGDDTHDPGGNVLNYYNDGLVSWLGIFGQLEYATDRISAFVSLSGSNQSFKRIDYFNYLESDPQRETDWNAFLGGSVKAGLNYNLDEHHNVFINSGLFSRQPDFDNVYINFINNFNEEASNQQVFAIEAGYGYRSAHVNLDFNLYHTNWGNRQFDESFRNYQYIFQGDTVVAEALAQFRGVEQLHQGVEMELRWRPSTKLRLNGMFSAGNWRYTKDFVADITDTDNNRPVGESLTLETEDLKIGDAAQLSFSAGVDYELLYGLNIYADYSYYDNIYADWNIEDGVPDQVAKLPGYGLVDAGVGYSLNMAGMDWVLRLNVNNVLDNIYVSELETSITDDPSTPNRNEFYDNRGFFGFGRTWNASLKVRF